jgi:protein-disulfide isomerase
MHRSTTCAARVQYRLFAFLAIPHLLELLPMFFTVKKLSLSLAAAFTLSAAATSFAQKAPEVPVTAEQRSQIESVIKSYLMKNPGILREVMVELERTETAAKDAKRIEMLAKNKAQIENDKDSPFIGNAKGDVVVTEFFDYRCGYCVKVANVLPELIKRDPNIRVVYKEFPILGPDSLTGAKAAIAAHRQSAAKYLPFHIALFNSVAINDTTISAAATSVGLDAAKVLADMKSPEVTAILDKNNSLALDLELNGTPAFIVGNKILPGAVSIETLLAAVRDQRNAATKKTG